MTTALSVLCVAGLLVFLFILPEFLPKRKPGGTEPGYYIRRRSDGYPMHVGSDAYDKALYTGDYQLEGRSGRRVPIGQQYTDD